MVDSKNPSNRPPGTVLQRTRPPPRSPSTYDRSSPGPLLRRTGVPNRNRDSRQAPPGGAPARSRPSTRRRRQSQRRQDGNQFYESADAPTDAEVMAKIDPPFADETPKPVRPYTPHEYTMTELREYWPNTSTSPTSNVEAVTQKIEWLARRLPGGFITAEQLAEQYFKGAFTRFESVEEKENVLLLAGELAQRRADTLTERKGEVVKPEDMAFADITNAPMSNSGGPESKSLADSMIRGVYPQLQDKSNQKPGLMDEALRTLRNNRTYTGRVEQRFLDKVGSLLPQQRHQQQQVKAVGQNRAGKGAKTASQAA